jgi:UDP-N-acetylmuramoylalanine--D-glutamate ligase
MSGPLPDRALVVGAARSGIAAAAALAARGAEVVLHDRSAGLDVAAPAGVTLARGGRESAQLVRAAEVLVKSPGVPDGAPVVAAARAAGLPVWSEVELGFRLLPAGARLVGVTGTNGKTTVAELAGAMLAEAGADVVVAGNVGVALSGVAADVRPDAIVVCELSSFQLEDVVTLRCAAAGLLNLTPDHLDRHGTMDEYGRCKLRMFERQRPGDTAVLNDDDPWVAALPGVPGDGRLVRTHGTEAERAGFAAGRLRGAHNRENVAVAAALARALGADDAAVRRAVARFAPIPHRLEHVGDVGGVSVWNDSKATNVDATLKALTAFEGGSLRIILGGSDKGADFAPLAAALAGHVRSAYLIGPAGRRMAPLVQAVVPAAVCDTLEPALDAALADAEPGDAILLAPACASFDEFTSYEARGDRFRELARARGARPTSDPEPGTVDGIG